ncbi:myb/SANT-like DNA-binding domain-containing protein 2 [Chrysemys picta bellii]|uniref:myb/SANT-like DNA-binding domain-containing protein 2 n=1 Tax=Chrysemys picta bellii TaxID=8478 RepID=UPI0032B1C631
MQSENRKRAPAWTVREVLDLIAVWGDDSMLSDLCSKRLNANTFEKISKGMMERGHNRDSTQCRVKVKELRQAYQKTKESNGCSGAEPQTCRFYAELHAILGGGATTTAPLTVDSKEGVLSAMPEDFADGEDEEEDELEESTQHTILPNSQDLFLTMTEIPSQGCMKADHEAIEGTSAAHFSSLPPPSQRLSQIRRRKKRTRDEMFSEIMLSTCNERTHLNVWKAAVSQYRKAANEREDRRDDSDERWRQEDQRRQDATLGLLRDQTDMLWRLVELQEWQQDHRVLLQLLFNCSPQVP